MREIGGIHLERNLQFGNPKNIKIKKLKIKMELPQVVGIFMALNYQNGFY